MICDFCRGQCMPGVLHPGVTTHALPSRRRLADGPIRILPPPHFATHTRGFTLIEILLIVGLIAILAAVALPQYQDYRYRIQVAQAITDIAAMSATLKQYQLDERSPPDSLAQVGLAGQLDPWGQPYRYLDLTEPGNLKSARKDKNLHPLNNDFDLYSIGRDGKSVLPLTAKPSRDDIIRANDGRFIGLGDDY